MKRIATIFLQVVIVLFGIGVLAVLLWEPHIEGRNAHATLFEIYFQDPFLAFAYTGSIPFFVALYQAFRLLGYIGRNEVFTQRSVKALRTIKQCGVITIGFVVAALIWILFFSGSEDKPGGIFMGIIITFACLIFTAAAAVFERLLQKAIDIKSDNDLTI